ncbi:MAG TPA: hypothetical protein VF267_06205, partial [Gammaproteobacteria bacterium]
MNFRKRAVSRPEIACPWLAGHGVTQMLPKAGRRRRKSLAESLSIRNAATGKKSSIHGGLNSKPAVL